MQRGYFIGLFVLYLVSSFLLAATTPIAPHEAKLYFSHEGIVPFFMHLGEHFVGGVLGIRILFLLFSVISIFMFYQLSNTYFKYKKDVYLATSLFMFLPGIITATVLANVGIVVLALVLLFVLLYEKGYNWLLPFVMLALFFIHEASVIFFIALFFYSFNTKERWLGTLSLAFLLAFIYLSKGIEIGGRPTGHFIEIFGLYAAVFSPLLFLYFFYTMYRIFLREKKHLMWYISFTALVISLLLSIRQKVYITDFAPYVMISTIAMVDIYMRSLRVRLPQYQRRYKQAFAIVVGMLVLSSLTIITHQLSYYMTQHPSKHFAYRIYHPYILAQTLQKEGVECYDAKGRMALQLKYYGISGCVKPE